MTISYTPSNIPIVTNILLEKRANDNHDIKQHFVKFPILFLSLKAMLPIVNIILMYTYVSYSSRKIKHISFHKIQFHHRSNNILNQSISQASF